jgi:hypothetical protein
LPDAGKPGVDSELLAWVREHWALVAGVLLALFVLWAASGSRPRENGRYVLVKDDVPCRSSGETSARRWCYIVLDSRTGAFEERVRKFRRR